MTLDVIIALIIKMLARIPTMTLYMISILTMFLDLFKEFLTVKTMSRHIHRELSSSIDRASW